MLKVSSCEDGYLNNWINTCDSCQAAACTVYCHTDSAYLCDDCDNNPTALSHHRQWICAACETAPATVFCSADAASLCTKCDIQIHSANPLASRHVRVPIPPLGLTCSTSSDHRDDQVAGTMFYTENEIAAPTVKLNQEIDEYETDPWLLLEPQNTDNRTMSKFTYGEQLHEYIDICTERYGQERCMDQQQIHGVNYREDSVNDSVVPLKTLKSKNQPLQQQKINFNSDYRGSRTAFTNYPSSSLRASMLLISAGIPSSYTRFPTTEIFPNPLVIMPLQFTSTMDREEKVMRYREKRKARKFEKKIRYASRKAYAETRPRIKGRFARKTDMGKGRLWLWCCSIVRNKYYEAVISKKIFDSGRFELLSLLFSYCINVLV